VITGLGSLVALAAAGAYSTLAAPSLGGVALAGCVAGLVVLAAGLILRWPATIPWAILLTGAGYVATRHGTSLVDPWSTVVGVLLLVTAELASWSVEHDARIRAEPALVLRRLLTIGSLVAAALLLDFILLAAAAVSASAGLLVAAAGAAAAVTAVAVVLRLVR
jgi:hypothetical protein